MIEISVVSGTYNRLSHLQRMVDSARASIPYGVPYEIILVDGGSTDGTLSWARLQPDVVLIEQGALLGAIKAFNAGANAAQGRYVILANDDVFFVGASIARALAFMHDHPDCGCGAFFQDRGGRDWHVGQMTAHHESGQNINVDYGQVAIYPRWLGNQVGWWGDFGSKTYGGDNYLSARIWEAGFKVLPVESAKIHDELPDDELRRANNVQRDGQHPDTTAYLTLYPHGPLIKARPVPDQPLKATRRILYAPIYEPGHAVQHRQKRGLRRALQRAGLVWEIDYVAQGVDAVIEAAQAWQPELIVTQFHDANMCTPAHARKLRKAVPSAKLINWNGDVYERASGDYLDMLRQFDLQTVVNAGDIPSYTNAGIRATYWQIGYEPDGVGQEPDERTPRHDVVFLGNGYSEARQAFARSLQAMPINVGIYGSGWPQGMSRGDTLYDFIAGCKLYRNARISVGDDQYQARGFVSNRFFQALAAGGAMLMHRAVPGLDELTGLVAGLHYIAFSNEAELRAGIDYYLSHEDERQAIAQAGHLQCLRGHSFERRVDQLLKWLYPTEPAWADPTLAVFQGGIHA